MEVKMVKLAEDTCFGEKFESIDQCSACWVKRSCHCHHKALLRARSR